MTIFQLLQEGPKNTTALEASTSLKPQRMWSTGGTASSRSPQHGGQSGSMARQEATHGQKYRQESFPAHHAPGSDLPFRRWRQVQVRTMWGKLDKGNGGQLLAEFFQYYHALE